jgi:broad specificity phosphatase PhoE
MRRLVLLRHARTAAVHGAAFPDAGARLDPVGRRAARAAALDVSRRGWDRDGAICSPLARAVETAALLGLEGAIAEPALREADFGSWTGRSLADVADEDPVSVRAWMTDADAVPHGGESLRAVVGRVGRWLDEQASTDGRSVAVTHGGVVKAAVVHALAAPLDAFWRVDVGPLAATELHAHDGRWTVAYVNATLAAVLA